MKKIISIIFITMIAFSFTACNREGDTQTETVTEVVTSVVEKTVEVTNASGETVTEKSGEAVTETVTEVVTKVIKKEVPATTSKKEKTKKSSKTSEPTQNTDNTTVEPTKNNETETTKENNTTSTTGTTTTTTKAATTTTTKAAATTTKSNTTSTTKTGITYVQKTPTFTKFSEENKVDALKGSCIRMIEEVYINGTYRKTQTRNFNTSDTGAINNVYKNEVIYLEADSQMLRSVKCTVTYNGKTYVNTSIAPGTYYTWDIRNVLGTGTFNNINVLYTYSNSEGSVSVGMTYNMKVE